jgi:hypothetical protein
MHEQCDNILVSGLDDMEHLAKQMRRSFAYRGTLTFWPIASIIYTMWYTINQLIDIYLFYFNILLMILQVKFRKGT